MIFLLLLRLLASHFYSNILFLCRQKKKVYIYYFYVYIYCFISLTLPWPLEPCIQEHPTLQISPCVPMLGPALLSLNINSHLLKFLSIWYFFIYPTFYIHLNSTSNRSLTSVCANRLHIVLSVPINLRRHPILIFSIYCFAVNKPSKISIV